MSSTQMSDPRELVLHELGDVLYAERTLVKALPKLEQEASDEELAKGFGDHLEETKQHVKNVEQAFEELGETVKAERGAKFYEEIGKKGGDRVKATRGPGFYEEIGRKGGQKVKQLIEEGKRAARAAAEAAALAAGQTPATATAAPTSVVAAPVDPNSVKPE